MDLIGTSFSSVDGSLRDFMQFPDILECDERLSLCFALFIVSGLSIVWSFLYVLALVLLL